MSRKEKSRSQIKLLVGEDEEDTMEAKKKDEQFEIQEENLAPKIQISKCYISSFIPLQAT